MIATAIYEIVHQSFCKKKLYELQQEHENQLENEPKMELN